MLKIGVKHNLQNTIRMLDERVRKQVPFATAKALTKTVQKVQSETYAEMRANFERPTPIVMRSLFIKPAKKTDLTAAVYLKGSDLGGKNRLGSMAAIIGHQFSGGHRRQKGIEYWLQRAGMISSGEHVAPGAGARLDQYGNISRGQLVQIMSQLRLGLDPYSWKSNSARSRRNVKKAGEFFWSRGGHLARGVWVRAGRNVRPVLMVISKPKYRQRIDMLRIAERVVASSFNAEFSKAFDEAVRTAR